MSLLGFDTVGRFALGQMPPFTGQFFAVVTMSGSGALAPTVSALARSTTAMAGTGTLATVSGPASGKLTAAGTAAMAATMTTKSNAVVTSGGIGSLSATMAALSRSIVSANGIGSFPAAMTAKVTASTSMQGSSSFGGSDQPGSVIAFAGYGLFAAVGYALFSDAEKAGPVYEMRVAQAKYELVVAVAPVEDRVYYTPGKVDPAGPPNRRRVL